LNSRQEVNQGVLYLRMKGFDIKNMMLVEYCESKDDAGYYRKYAAFRIDDQIIPGHLIFNNNWLVKDGKPPFEKSHELEKERYIKDNPHEEEIFKIFELAGTTYGRIDYSMLNGSIQTWEINTNPVLNLPRNKLLKERKELIPVKEKLAKRLEDKLMSINYGSDVAEAGKRGHKISLNWDIYRTL
jgi:hypothetical protein